MKTWRFTGALARSAVLALILAAGAHAHAEEGAATVDVNTADAETIASVLDGVGLTKAEAIVRYREENGRFTDAYDLTQVRGIGDATVARNEERIALGD